MRATRAAEIAAAGAGDTYLASLSESLGEVLAGGGLQLTSASTAGKSFTYAVGYSVQSVEEALEDAQVIWDQDDSDALDRLLLTRRLSSTVVRFA